MIPYFMYMSSTLFIYAVIVKLVMVGFLCFRKTSRRIHQRPTARSSGKKQFCSVLIGNNKIFSLISRTSLVVLPNMLNVILSLFAELHRADLPEENCLQEVSVRVHRITIFTCSGDCLTYENEVCTILSLQT